ncbi:MAG TPA: hypothetical protein V6C63_14220 [Allocoleopsis sp.]
MNNVLDRIHQGAIVPIKNCALTQIFPNGVPVLIPDGGQEPTLSLNGDEYYEIYFPELSDFEVSAIASLYSSDRVPPILASTFAFRTLAIIPASWIGGAA